MPEWLLRTLGANGLAGVFIFALLSAIIGLWIAFKSKDRELKKLHEQRALEREAMAKLLEQGASSAISIAAATEKRNDVMMVMAQALAGLTSAVDKYEERVGLQADMLADKFADFRHVVDSFGESNRVISGTISEIRNQIISLIAEIRILSSRS